LGTYLGKTSPENPPVSMNPLFPEDSVSTDSDEDLAEEFFRFMIWNDLSGEEEEEDSSFIEDEELEGSISATDLFAEIDDFDDIITDDFDDYDDDGYLPQVSDNRVRFSPFSQEARYGFSLQARPKTFPRRLWLKFSLE
jgi:hypothetical protein